MFEYLNGRCVLLNTVAQIGSAAKLAGVKPSVLLDRLLSALEDEARGDAERSA